MKHLYLPEIVSDVYGIYHEPLQSKTVGMVPSMIPMAIGELCDKPQYYTLLKAIETATVAHGKYYKKAEADDEIHPQRRDCGELYITHPVMVAAIAYELFGIKDPAMLCAAVLHDVIEDTTMFKDFGELGAHLYREFNDHYTCHLALKGRKDSDPATVASDTIAAVRHLTNPTKALELLGYEVPKRATRKKIDRYYAAHMPFNVRLIKMADMYHNIVDGATGKLEKDGTKFYCRYLDEQSELLEVLKDGCFGEAVPRCAAHVDLAILEARRYARAGRFKKKKKGE